MKVKQPLADTKTLRKIDKIVFNQDKTHYAVLWADGGFCKFDVSSIQVIQRVRNLPITVEVESAASDFAPAAPLPEKPKYTQF